MITITIQATDNTDLHNQITELFALTTYDNTEAANAVLKEWQPEGKRTQEVKASEAKPKKATAPKEEPKEEPKEASISMDEAKAKVADFIRTNGNEKVKEMLGTLGVAKVSLIPDDQLPKALEMLGIAYE